jgi:hypothetical protein
VEDFAKTARDNDTPIRLQLHDNSFLAGGRARRRLPAAQGEDSTQCAVSHDASFLLALFSALVVQIDEGRIQAHLDEVVRSTVEETLNALLDAEADHLCGARKYERSEGRKDTRAGSYDRRLQTKAGEVTLTVPKLRNLPFETAIIERYRRRESSWKRL